VPARVKDLSRLPPAFIGVGALDLFIEEDLDYASRLIAAGVPVEVHVSAGAYHGFDGLAPETPLARQFTATLIAALRRLSSGSVA
jgi:acetyl esterase/lipase